MPALTIEENGDRVRLALGGFARGEGSSLQEAADSLIRRVVELALAFRASGYRVARELQPDLEALTLLYEVADIAARAATSAFACSSSATAVPSRPAGAPRT